MSISPLYRSRRLPPFFSSVGKRRVNDAVKKRSMTEDRHVRREGIDRKEERYLSNRGSQSKLTTGCCPEVVALAVPGWILHLTKLGFLVGTSPTHPLHIVYVLYNRGSHMSYFRLYFSYIVYKMAVYDVWPSCHIIIINDATQGSLTYIQSHSGYLYLDVMAVLLHMANEFRACTISNGWSLLCRRRTVACLQLHDRKWRLKCLTV